jgi:hypothetical protein
MDAHRPVGADDHVKGGVGHAVRDPNLVTDMPADQDTSALIFSLGHYSPLSTGGAAPGATSKQTIHGNAHRVKLVIHILYKGVGRSIRMYGDSHFNFNIHLRTNRCAHTNTHAGTGSTVTIH